VLKFLVIFMIIFVAFIVGINNLYWYFPTEVRSHVEINPHYDPATNSTGTIAGEEFGT
jgi:hypothetical protein